MSNCTNCFNGCTEIISDRCVRYTGIDVPALGITTGDTLSSVESSIVNFLVPVLTGVGVKPIIDDNIICTTVRQYLPPCTTCTGFTLNEMLTAIIKAACDLQVQIDAVVAELDILNADYTIGCLTGVTASSDTHAIVQAVITKLCQLNSNFEQLLVDLPNTYVPINATPGHPGINDYIQAYIDNNSNAGLISNKMVPYAVLPYFGPLSNFNSQGAGLDLTTTTGENWTNVNLCNGNNSTPDLRGRALTGAISSVPGPAITDPVVLPGGNNPNYVLGNPYGANQVTLGPTQIPTHIHPNELIFVDPQHTHTFAPDTNMNFGSSGVSRPTTAIESASTGRAISGTIGSSSTGITVTLTNKENTGGGLPHPNIQPVIACYYIQYRPV